MIFKNEDMTETEKRIKVVMTPAGTEWLAEKEYKLLDYISDGIGCVAGFVVSAALV